MAHELRTALLDLHRELLQAQRIEAERFGGRMSASETLQAATDDLRFNWLKPVSELIAEMDEGASHEGAPADQEARLVVRVKELLAPPDPSTAFGARYLRALQDHPEVVVAHGAVRQALERRG